MTLKVDRTNQEQIKRISDAGEHFLFTAAHASAYYVKSVEELLKAPTINYGSRLLDNNITPMRPGELTVTIARPGNGKTSFLIYMARKHAQYLQDTNQNRKKCVIYITWEEPVESIEMSIQSGEDYTAEQIAWGTVDIDVVRRNSTGRAGLPLHIIGKSLVKGRNKRKPPMTIDRVIDTIYALFYEHGFEPVLICGDYLQKIPVHNKRDRISEVTEAIFSLNEMTININCPVLLAVQATREVDHHGLPIPTLDSGQWTSAIEQEAFRMLGLLRPVTIIPKNGQPLEWIEIGGKEYKVTKDLMIVRLIKQRKYFPPINTLPVYFKPDKFELFDVERGYNAP